MLCVWFNFVSLWREHHQMWGFLCKLKIIDPKQRWRISLQHNFNLPSLIGTLWILKNAKEIFLNANVWIYVFFPDVIWQIWCMCWILNLRDMATRDCVRSPWKCLQFLMYLITAVCLYAANSPYSYLPTSLNVTSIVMWLKRGFA